MDSHNTSNACRKHTQLDELQNRAGKNGRRSKNGAWRRNNRRNQPALGKVSNGGSKMLNYHRRTKRQNKKQNQTKEQTPSRTKKITDRRGFQLISTDDGKNSNKESGK